MSITKYSLDASTQDTRTTPAQAYKFAKGEALGIQPWSKKGEPLRTMQLDRPIDFAGVTDHAELFGEVYTCSNPKLEDYSSLSCKVYRTFPRFSFFYMNIMAVVVGKHFNFCADGDCREAGLPIWQEIQQAAEDAYDRSSDCSFTSFVAYEWTGASPTISNTHRNVIFRNAEVPRLPFSFQDSEKLAVNLYNQLDEACIEADGSCDVLVIPHNSNLSDGFMFKTSDEGGLPMTQEDAEQRARFETLVELIQHKGSSECFYQAGFSEDELCAFEQLPYSKLGGNFNPFTPPPEADDGFIRATLHEGIKQQQRLGENPFKIGFIGSTDTHLGTPGAVSEKGFTGHGGAGIPASNDVPAGLVDELEFSPGGLAAVWAVENSRDALFDAMRQRETYATSGPRIKVRFFGGWDYPEALCDSTDLAEQGYARGVAMGGDLTAVPDKAKSPHFVVSARQDTGTTTSPGMPLQRLQIVKGWVDSEGKGREKVFDIAGNPNNGASVDLNTCQASGAGYSQLCTVWEDPHFNPEENSYYYARAVENPSCRWSQYICANNKVDCSKPDTVKEGLEACCTETHRPVIQERAVTSPIWYSAERADNH